MSLSKIFKWLVLLGLPIIMWRCYWYVGFNQETTKLICFFITFVVFLFVGKEIVKKKKKGYDKYVSGIVFLFLVSLLTSYVYWGQSPMLTYRAGVGTLSILYYYILHQFRVNNKELYRIVFILAIIYTVLWLYALSKAPEVVFGNLDEVQDSRGFYRILQLPSIDIVCVLFFVFLVRSSYKNKKLIWGLMAVGCFVVIFLSLSRMLIFSVLIVSILYVFRNNLKIAFIISIFLFFGYERIFQNEIVESMIEMTETQINEDEESNLRLVEYNHMFTAYPLHVGTTLFGNGVPHANSNYGKYNEKLKMELGFHQSDAGYVGIFANYGVAMLFLLGLLLVRVIFKKIPNQLQPYRLFIVSLFIYNLTSYSFWNFGISFAIALYALNMIEYNNKIVQK